MNRKLSGREIAADNLTRFNAWVVERDSTNDWQDFIRGDKLNRSELANECGFALSVVRQNPSIKEALASLEARLLASGVLGSQKATERPLDAKSDDVATLAVNRRVMIAKGMAEQRVKVLAEQNAALRAEVRSLREQLMRFKHLDEYLSKTGRLLP